MIVLSRDHLRQSIVTKTLGVNAVLEVMPNALNIVKVERNLLITKKKNNCCIIRAMSVSKVHAFENVKYLKS